MTYLSNKYTTWYNSIITNAQYRVNLEGYTEKHHIIPKSLGGSDDPNNLVKLTAKEHFICHRLLIKMTTGISKQKMAHAAWAMATLRNTSQRQRHKINSRTYESLRKTKTMSEETKKKISKKLTGRKFPKRTPEHSAKLGQYIRTDIHRNIISSSRKAQTGLQKRSAETKAKMSAWQKGIPKPKLTCEHCNKSVSYLNYRRWHGVNCKLLRQ